MHIVMWLTSRESGFRYSSHWSENMISNIPCEKVSAKNSGEKQTIFTIILSNTFPLVLAI